MNIPEPSTVPQTIRLDAISSESATVSWKSPKVNNGPEVRSFTLSKHVMTES